MQLKPKMEISNQLRAKETNVYKQIKKVSKFYDFERKM